MKVSLTIHLTEVSLFLTLMLLLQSCKADIVIGKDGNYATGAVSESPTSALQTTLRDADGYEWIVPATASSSFSLARTDGTNYISYRHDASNPGSLASDIVTGAICDGDGDIWIATQKGVDRFDRKKGSFDHIEIPDENTFISSIALGPENRICIATRRHIHEYNAARGVFEARFKISSLTQDEPDMRFEDNGNLICVFDTLTVVFDREFHELSRQKVHKDSSSQLPDKDLMTAGKPAPAEVYDVFSNTLEDVLKHIRVTDYAKTERYLLFFGEGNLLCYDMVAKRFTDKRPVRKDGLDGTPVLSEAMAGKFVMSGDLRSASRYVVYSVNNYGELTIEKTAPTPAGSLVFLDADGDVYAAGVGTTIFKSDEDGALKEVCDVYGDGMSYASLTKCLSDGRILVCFTDHPPVIFNPEDCSVEMILCERLQQVYYNSAAETPDGTLWIGTSDNGLYRCGNGSRSLETVRGTDFYNISELEVDTAGNLVVLVNRRDVYLVKGMDIRHLWKEKGDKRRSRFLMRMPDGKIALAGYLEYVPLETTAVKEALSLPASVILTSEKNVLTSFRTDNYPGGKVVIRMNRLTKGLTMYLGLFGEGEDIGYMQYLYDVNNSKTGLRESQTMQAIPLYGVTKINNKVVFRISESGLRSMTEPFTIVIRMNALWYEIMIPLLVLALLTAVLFFARKLYRKRQEVEKERFQKQALEQLNMDNIDFFANISHEFRTPLTLINGASTMLDDEASSSERERSLGIIRRNTDRMLKLVGQMLDFNKLDHGMLGLKVCEEPVSQILAEVKSSFDVGARIKDIDFRISLPDVPIRGWCDHDKLENIMYNLCSNAMKYTAPGGSVNIDVRKSPDQMLTVAVEDTGIGIPENELGSVFTRFYRREATQKSGGTGIGLFYTKALTELHHGRIKAEARHDPQSGEVSGSVFTFSIPLSEGSYSDGEKSAPADLNTSVKSHNHLDEYAAVSIPEQISGGKPTVLLIDDDYELVYYLKSLLSPMYDVSFRFDAMSGYRRIEDLNPDIIICDVMMVEMDGIQLCRMVKDNIAMSHIPFVMLTAKSTVQDQITSLESGADAYVVKPFDPGYLLALVKSILDNRARLHQMFNTSISVSEDDENSLNPKDCAFMDRMYKIMEANLKDGELSIDSVAESLGVSRSKLYYKVKALTGQTPNDFFNIYKLNYSAELIKMNKYKISAIAEMLGFKSASHFANLFKKHFGVLPSQYGSNE